MLDEKQGLSIPGQIESIEMKTLYKIFKNVSLSDGDCVVEFGTYYGRSTYCIAKGLQDNKCYSSKIPFFAFDAFQSSKNGAMAPSIIDHAKKYHILQLIEETSSAINFQKAFIYYMQKFGLDSMITPISAKLHSSNIPDHLSVAAIHVDSAKFYREFKPILYRFIPKLRLEGIIIFQDYFFQWSATLISCINYMIGEGYLSPLGSAASSLICRKVKDLPDDFIYELDIKMESSLFVLSQIERSENLLQGISLDRRERFMPRITLAKLQFLYDSGQHSDAADIFRQMIIEGMPKAALHDFLQLFSSGFTVRNQFEADEQL